MGMGKNEERHLREFLNGMETINVVSDTVYQAEIQNEERRRTFAA